MFQYLWPEEDVCECCGTQTTGAMLYMSDIPVSFTCKACEPEQYKQAVASSLNLKDEIELNGWEWHNPDNHETLYF